MFKSLLWALCALAVAGVIADPVQPRVSLLSQPAGATVIIDGVDRGVTPITLFDLTPGRHHIKYRLAGYAERDRFINMDEGPFIERNVVLAEEKGLLLLKTDPEGCDISINGVSMGKTPRPITTLASKDVYQVKLRKAGFLDHSIAIKFDGRKPLVREETMIPASGRLDIMSEPSGAEVMVNGVVRGTTPVKVDNVPKGRASVKFTLNGFAEEIRELAIGAGESQSLSVILRGLPGTLHLVSVPEGARFYVNDEPCGKGPVVMSDLKPGKYEVRAELEGYGTMIKTVNLDNGASATEEFRLSNQMGRLEIKTSPVGVQLILDGRLVGTTKSNDPAAEFSDVFTIENVMEGEHTLIARKDGHAEVIRHPRIASTKTSQQRIRMARLFIPDVEIVTATGSYKGVLKSNSGTAVEVEVALGIIRSFSRDEIREMKFLNAEP